MTAEGSGQWAVPFQGVPAPIFLNFLMQAPSKRAVAWLGDGYSRIKFTSSRLALLPSSPSRPCPEGPLPTQRPAAPGSAEHAEAPGSRLLPGWAFAPICRIHLDVRAPHWHSSPRPTWPSEGRKNGVYMGVSLLPLKPQTPRLSGGSLPAFQMTTNNNSNKHYHAPHLSLRTHGTLLSRPVYKILGSWPEIRSQPFPQSVFVPLDILCSVLT